jgi:hypothetical protein
LKRTIAAILTALGIFGLSAWIHPLERQDGKPSLHQIYTDLEIKYGEHPEHGTGPKTKIPVIPIAPANAEAQALQKIVIEQKKD